MADYDDDFSDSSSLSDLPDGTETGVVLGYAAENATHTDGADSQSHLGGYPSWLDTTQTPSGSLAKCRVCNGNMSLLLQLSADLKERFPHDERRLHLFCCRKRACARKVESIRAVRETRRTGGTGGKAPPVERPAAKTVEKEEEGEGENGTDMGRGLGGMLFGVSSPSSTAGASGGNPFSTKPSTTTGTAQPVNPFSSMPPLSSLAAKPPQLPHSESSQPPTETFASRLKISSEPSSSSPTSKTTSQAQPQPTPSPPAAPSKPQDDSPWPPQSSFPTPYPAIPLESDYEIIYPSDTTNFKSRSSGPSKSRYDEEDMDLDPNSNTNTDDAHARKPSETNDRKSTQKDSDKELFESTMDTTFQRFCDRLSHNPLQVLRYEFGGTPLLYADNDAVAGYFTKHTATGTKGGKVQVSKKVKPLPPCPHCNAARVFEMQLVPGAISALEDDDDTIGIEEGMEWGTVIVGVCGENCAGAEGDGDGKVVFREEWVGVQWEERVVRAK